MIGTVLLLLPLSSAGPTSIGFTYALFTSVSAVCVTGLAVVSTGSDLSMFGQTVVMVLVQLGGLGFMVFGISIAILLGKVTGLKYRQLLQTTTNSLSARGLLRIAMIVLLFALLLEGGSTLVLTWRWHEELGWQMPSIMHCFIRLQHLIMPVSPCSIRVWNSLWEILPLTLASPRCLLSVV